MSLRPGSIAATAGMLLFAFAALVSGVADSAEEAGRPNIIVILDGNQGDTASCLVVQVWPECRVVNGQSTTEPCCNVM